MCDWSPLITLLLQQTIPGLASLMSPPCSNLAFLLLRAPGLSQITPCFLNQFYEANSLISESTIPNGGLLLAGGNKARNQITTSNSTQTISDLCTLGCSFINDLSLARNTIKRCVIRKQIYCLQMGGRDKNPRMFREKVLFCSESCPGVGRVSLPWIPAGQPPGNPGKKPALWYTSLRSMTHWVTF